METNRKTASKSRLKDYIVLHLSVLLFSFTSVFTKLASLEFSKSGIYSRKLYLFLFLMLLNCFVYAIVWQKVIARFELSVAYANKSVYLIWTQVWAVLFFHETLTPQNIIGLGIVLAGVLVVQSYE